MASIKYKDNKLGRMRKGVVPTTFDKNEVQMASKYKGVCTVCFKDFYPGAEIQWNKNTKKARHLLCFNK